MGDLDAASCQAGAPLEATIASETRQAFAMMVSVGFGPCRSGTKTRRHIEVIDVMRTAVSVKHRGGRIVAHAGRSVLMRAIASDSLGVDLLNALRACGFQNVAGTINQERPCSRSWRGA